MRTYDCEFVNVCMCARSAYASNAGVSVFRVGSVLYAAAFTQFGVCLPFCTHTHAYAPIIAEANVRMNERADERTY